MKDRGSDKPKKTQRAADRAAPADWMNLVNEKGDLDLAFDALDGWDHFYTDTIRGRIRSLQLRPKEAELFFERSQARVEEFPNTHRNFLRRFYHKIYVLENSVIAESAPEGGDPDLTDKVLEDLMNMEIPETEVALQTRQYHKGVLFLNRGKFTEAKRCFLRIIKQSHGQMGDEKTAYYLGAAVALKQLGQEKDANWQIENASLIIPTLENTLNMGIYSASLSAFLDLWGREAEAEEWRDFLFRLKMPEKTRQLLLQRKERVVTRSRALGRVFVF